MTEAPNTSVAGHGGCVAACGVTASGHQGNQRGGLVWSWWPRITGMITRGRDHRAKGTRWRAIPGRWNMDGGCL